MIAVGKPEWRKEHAIKSSFRDWDVLVHPRACLATPSSTFGPGTMVFALAYIGPSVEIGRHVIIETGAMVAHDCVINDFVTLGQGANVCGGAWLGEGCFIGAGAVVTPGALVPAGKLVKAGTVWSKR